MKSGREIKSTDEPSPDLWLSNSSSGGSEARAESQNLCITEFATSFAVPFFPSTWKYRIRSTIPEFELEEG
jgi:hypothetical protein